MKQMCYTHVALYSCKVNDTIKTNLCGIEKSFNNFFIHLDGSYPYQMIPLIELTNDTKNNRTQTHSNFSPDVDMFVQKSFSYLLASSAFPLNVAPQASGNEPDFSSLDDRVEEPHRHEQNMTQGQFWG